MNTITLVSVFVGLMGLAFLYAAKVPQTVRPRVREVSVKITADLSKFVEAMNDFGLSVGEAADAINQMMTAWAGAVARGIDTDESHGMTLDELIPEAIAEWRQTKGDL